MSILFTNADVLLRTEQGWECVSDTYLGVEGTKIDYIGSERPAKAYEEEKNMKGKLLMPGLINCHDHSPMVLLRGIGSGLCLQDWLFNKVFPIEDRLTPEDIAAASRYALLETIAGGTTSFSDMYFFAKETLKAVGEAGLKANLNRCVQCFDENQSPSENTQIAESLALFKDYNGAYDDRIHIDFSIHAEYTCKPRIVQTYSELCAQHQGRMHIHLAETQKEQQECIERYGMTPTEWFAHLGTFASPTAAAHCVAVSESDMDILAANGVSIVHNPTSNLKLGSGFAPIRRMLDRGINVALGTDGASSNNNLNMFEEMHLAAVMHCGFHNDATIIGASEVIDMATRNGARLQGRDTTGALSVGMAADVIAIDMDQPHLYPNFDTAALLTYSAQASDVCMTMVDGKILYENGIYLTLDEEKVRAEMKTAVKRLYQ